MKISNKQIFAFMFLLGLVILSPELFAQTSGGAPSLSGLNGQVQQATNNVKLWANWIIGAVVLIGTIFSVFALMNGNPNAKNYVIGTVVGLVVWAIVNSIV